MPKNIQNQTYLTLEYAILEAIPCQRSMVSKLVSILQSRWNYLIESKYVDYVKCKNRLQYEFSSMA